MELEDLPGVFALGERLFTAEAWPNLYRTWDEYELVAMFAADGDTCLVAEQDDEIVGFALGTIIEKRRSAWSYGWLVWLSVAPEVRRSSVGSRLVDRLTELFLEQGARMMLVDTDAQNEPALAFFEARGFGNPRGHLYLTRNLAQEMKRTHRGRRAGDGSKKTRKRGVPSPPGGGDHDP